MAELVTDNNLQKVDTNVIQQNVDTNLTQKVATDQEATKTEEVQEDPNWKAFREARKKDREERQAAEKRAAEKEIEVAALKAAMEAALSTNSAQNSRYQYENTPHEETEDERIEKKVQAAIAQREAAAEKARLEREHQEYPNRLTQTFPDFNNTIAQENLDYLDYHYPEVSKPLQSLQDGFDKWAHIYRAVKKFVPGHSTAKKDSARADANFAKPKSMSSIGVTQNKEAVAGNRLTEDRKAQNWERMQKLLKGIN